MKREPNPYKIATMSTRQVDMYDGRHAIVRKALDSTEADRRRQLPSGTVKLEKQATGWAFIEQVIKREYEDPRSKRFLGHHLGAAARMGGIYTSATGTSDVQFRHTDIPIMAEDEWRMSESGLWLATNGIIEQSAKYSQELTFRHLNNMSSGDRTRRAGRAFGSAAAHLFNFGLPLPAGTPFEIQRTVRERVMDAEFDARKMVSETGKHYSVSALPDPNTVQSAWMLHNAPTAEVYDSLTQAYDELRAAA